MNALTIYTVVEADTEKKSKLIHGIKIPKANIKSLCGINTEEQSSFWRSTQEEINCPECLEVLAGRKKEYVYDKTIGESYERIFWRV